MFYDTTPYREALAPVREDRTYAIVVLTPPESRRLIAKGIVILPEIKRALDAEVFVICRGITTAYVAEEVLGVALPRANGTAGIVADGRLGSTLPAEGVGPWVIRAGELSEENMDEAVQGFKGPDVLMKGVNAVDPEGNVATLAGDKFGGTVGHTWATATARGTNIIVPVGLEKLIPSVTEAAMKCGQQLFKYVMGASVSLMPVINCRAVTEIQAIEMLTGVTATHVASGGVSGSEGSVILSLEGSDENVSAAFELIKSIKGEEFLALPNMMPALIS